MSDTDESLVMVDYAASIDKDDIDDEPELIQEDKGTVEASSMVMNADPVVIDSHSDMEPSAANAKNTVAAEAASTPLDPQLPRAIQIVSIGKEDDPYAFVFNTNAIQDILEQIPFSEMMEVAIVSVVGAFRTGKSFLLSWFIKYLQILHAQLQVGDAASTPESSKRWYEELDSIGNSGFDWRAGSDRNTTGIWIWSEPYQISKNKVVLLVDTQGMFDHETTMALTTNIFGFSTLLSSYQIYNVDKRIQEDHLQQLALFSEYARLMSSITSTKDEVTQKNDSDIPTPPSQVSQTERTSTEKRTSVKKPFQKIEFLVRDWQHFDDEHIFDENDDINFEVVEQNMMSYLDKVLGERDAKDLQETREQIIHCFDAISCYGLCHPGIAVTKKKYSGTVTDIEPMFVQLVARYCEKVFDLQNLPSKTINGRTITADQLNVYVQEYAKLFTSMSSQSTEGSSGINFPTATTMLEATASANNTNAVRKALTHYKSTMNRIAGPNVSHFVSQDEFAQEHNLHQSKSLHIFDSMANFGSQKQILSCREQLVQDLSSAFETYKTMNDGRNPLAGVEMYVPESLICPCSLILYGFLSVFVC
jgi:atlastin